MAARQEAQPKRTARRRRHVAGCTGLNFILFKWALGPFFVCGVNVAQAAKELQLLLEPGVEALGFELLGIEHLAQGRHSLLRLYIDGPDGITVDDCERVSHQVSGVLEVEEPIKGQYTLEVSSPGLDRPLFKPEHYQRFIGETIALRLLQPLEGRRKFKGKLVALRGDNVVIEQDGSEIELPLVNIDRAHLVPQW